MRSVLIAEKKNFKQSFINKIFDAIWREGLNLNDDIVIEKIIKSFKIDSKIFLDEISKDEIKEELKKRTTEAYEKGVFGLPTFLINNKIFWGQDRLEFVLNEAKKTKNI